jgi:flagellar biosynthesis protein FlhF
MQHALGTECESGSAEAAGARADVDEPAAAVADVGIVTANLQPVLAKPATSPVADATLNAMQHEIASLRGLLETQLSGLIWKNNARRSPLRAQVLRNLARLGVTPDIATIIVNRLEPMGELKHIWQQPLAALAQLMPVNSSTLLQAGGTAALIGPTGVGKTTTIAKLAARFAMQHGTDSIALVCADAYRIGAREHLTAFANILGIQVHAASDPAELGAILDRLRAKKLVLIDTEGLSQRDADLTSRLAALRANDERVKFYLTLSASSQETVLDETIRRFNKVALAGAIVTKVDEAGQLGCMISAIIRNKLPLTWIADGQRIPDDLHAAERKKLWLLNRAVECMDASQPRIDERTMAENYGTASTAHA